MSVFSNGNHWNGGSKHNNNGYMRSLNITSNNGGGNGQIINIQNQTNPQIIQNDLNNLYNGSFKDQQSIEISICDKNHWFIYLYNFNLPK